MHDQHSWPVRPAACDILKAAADARELAACDVVKAAADAGGRVADGVSSPCHKAAEGSLRKPMTGSDHQVVRPTAVAGIEGGVRWVYGDTCFRRGHGTCLRRDGAGLRGLRCHEACIRIGHCLLSSFVDEGVSPRDIESASQITWTLRGLAWITRRSTLEDRFRDCARVQPFAVSPLNTQQAKRPRHRQ